MDGWDMGVSQVKSSHPDALAIHFAVTWTARLLRSLLAYNLSESCNRDGVRMRLAARSIAWRSAVQRREDLPPATSHGGGLWPPNGRNLQRDVSWRVHSRVDEGNVRYEEHASLYQTRTNLCCI
jgi:hypothetical protein